MNTEISTELPSKLLPITIRTWWVKFEAKNGRILTITPKKITDLTASQLIVQVDNMVCRDILKGTANKNDYAMLWDYKALEWKLDVKSTTLVLKPLSNKLLPIQIDKSPEICDLYLKVFKTENKILITINLKNVMNTMNLADIQLISGAEGTSLLDIFLTKKNDPDYLIACLPVNALDLIQEEKVLIELPDDIIKLIEWDNISIYTKPIFDNYGLEYSVGKTAPPRNNSVDITQAQNNPEYCDINMYVVNKNLVVKSLLTDNQLYYFRSLNKFNIVVSDTEVDRYVGNIELSTIDICNGVTQYIPLPAFWPDRPILTFKSNYATISYTGENNAN